MCGVSPHTRLIPLGAPTLGVLALGVLALAGGCGEPPQPLPTSPPYVNASDPPISLGPSQLGLPAATTPPTLAATPTIGGVVPTYPTYPGYTPRTATTTPATTVSPTPTPSHAPRCTGAPTGAQILALIKGKPGIPNTTLQVNSGPYCSGTWSFTTVEKAGSGSDQLEPLMVVATGKDTTLTLVAAGSEVCTDQVQTTAPPGIRVLACGF
jgi:hypothetical protein